ncbi:hypothetical protein PIB30_051110 [Stylosanthes scabra]|uniref:Clathrin/coatomer adaptor adaptin-like N-terminal domain-containing protein n=1 Tax=Stylosanthes scabra TaxID=79078 RepID=A0ABU6THI9_9FABA|nr:hypothetical protein [Stylosanthes scabra]
MKEYVRRLLYVEMLGHDASFGYIHAVKMTHDDALPLKRTGYLAVTLFLSDDHDLIILIVNTIQKDLHLAARASSSHDCFTVGEWCEVGLHQCRWGWVRHWWLEGAVRVTYGLATALNQCMSVVGGRGSIGGSTSAAGGATALGRWGVTPDVLAALVEERVPWVNPTALMHPFGYKYGWVGAELTCTTTTHFSFFPIWVFL